LADTVRSGHNKSDVEANTKASQDYWLAADQSQTGMADRGEGGSGNKAEGGMSTSRPVSTPT
jgi:S-adenosylmethionine synthetase